MTDTAAVKPSSRPYTAYNIFFQIEREFILQHDLGVVPNLRMEEVFDFSDQNYKGPALPPRYQDIILADDWYIPGKALRKKRKHRASHGKISFVELSKKVSSSWRSCGNQVKLFCAQVSDIGMIKYKREMYQCKKKKKEKTHVAATKSRSSNSKVQNVRKLKGVLESKKHHTTTTCAIVICGDSCQENVTPSPINLAIQLSSLHAELSSILMRINNEAREMYISDSNSNAFGLVDTVASAAMSMSPPVICPVVSCPQISTTSLNLPVELSSPLEIDTSYPKTFGQVDMQDGEIFDMWMSSDEPSRTQF